MAFALIESHMVSESRTCWIHFSADQDEVLHDIEAIQQKFKHLGNTLECDCVIKGFVY